MNSRPFRPLFITASLAEDSPQRHSVTLMNRLDERGQHCHGVYLRDERTLLGRVRLGAGGSMFCPLVSSYLDLPALKRLAAHVARLQPDILVSANGDALNYAILVRWRTGLRIPLVVIFHPSALRGPKARLKMSLERQFCARIECLVHGSETQLKYLQARGLAARRNEVIVKGVDTECFQVAPFVAEGAAIRRQFGLADSDYVIGMPAVLTPEKSPLLLVEATSELRAQGIPAKALLIGDGEMRPAIEARARLLGIEAHVAITGWQIDVRPALAACNVVSLCGTNESLPQAALEAMAMNRPVVLAESAGTREIVESWLNGFLFPPDKRPELVARLARLADASLARLMGDKARSFIETQFSESQMVDRYEQLLGELVFSGPQFDSSTIQ